MAVYYYIDYTNGNNSATGLRIPAGDYNSTTYYQIDSTADTTHFVDAALSGLTIYSGAYFYNVTRSIGALVTGWNDATDTITLGSAVAGMAAGDNYYILASWKNVSQFMTATTRTAGGNDYAYIRANQTHTISAEMTFDENGSFLTPNWMIGCNATQGIDPWHDGSSVNPAFDFGYGSYKFQIGGSAQQNSWRFKNLTWQNTNITSYCLLTVQYSSYDFQFYNCVFNLYYGVSMLGSSTTYINGNLFVFDTCTFHPGYGASPKTCYHAGADVKYINCTFKKYTSSQGPFLLYSAPNTIYVYDSTFEAGFTYGCVELRLNSRAYFRNCLFNSNALADWTGTDPRMGSGVFSEDNDQTAGAFSSTSYTADITRDTSVIHAGGATSSMKVMPRSVVSAGLPVLLPVFVDNQFMSCWCPASATTITVYVRSVTTWGGTYPTASELYFTASYPSSATTGARTNVSSTAVLSDATTWVGYTMTFTPTRAGFVYISLYLSKYVASNGIYVDIKPVIS